MKHYGKLVRRYYSSLCWSYVHGASTTPLLYRTIGDILEENVEKYAQRTAFVFPKQNARKTYEEFYVDVNKLSNGLLSLGLQMGDRVGMWGPNTYEWVVAQFATSLAGLIFVTINPAYEADELVFSLKKVGVKCLIAATGYRKQNYHAILSSVIPNLSKCAKNSLSFEKLPELKSLIFLDEKPLPGAWTFQEVCHMGNMETEERMNKIKQIVQADDPVHILFTSGTTGGPKGATLSHFNIVNNAYFIGQRLEYDKKVSRICCPPPLYHCFGSVAGSLSSVIHGGTCVFPSLGFEAASALAAIHDEKCTSLYGTPTMFIDMLSNDKFHKYNYASMSTGIIAGATCPVELCSDIVHKLNMKNLTVLYGTTENSPGTFQSTTSCNMDNRVSTVGKVHDHVEAKIVDENYQLLSVNKTGEVCIRGYCVMLNYWNDGPKTDEVIGRDGWYKTGDLATMDEQGRLKIVGRKKDLVIRGGENIYPAEVEQFFHSNSKVLDAQVIGVPDNRLGEEVCVWIRLKEGTTCSEQEIREFCKGKISYFKIPRYIMFKQQNDFPVTVTGKIQKYKMREIAIAELHL